MLKQAGGTNGDKHFNGEIPNMKLGEYRYYPQDNPNLTMISRNKITRKAFIRILNKSFPGYIVNPDLDSSHDVDLKYYVQSVGIANSVGNDGFSYEPLVINKGYICFKEATLDEDGTILYLHSGVVMTYKERYIRVT